MIINLQFFQRCNLTENSENKTPLQTVKRKVHWFIFLDTQNDVATYSLFALDLISVDCVLKSRAFEQILPWITINNGMCATKSKNEICKRKVHFLYSCRYKHKSYFELQCSASDG